jgi:hypothetical protein
MTQFLNTSYAGSYYQDCEMLGYVVYDPKVHGSDLTKILIELGRKQPEDDPKFGHTCALIEYQCDVLDDLVVECITLDRLIK